MLHVLNDILQFVVCFLVGHDSFIFFEVKVPL